MTHGIRDKRAEQKVLGPTGGEPAPPIGWHARDFSILVFDFKEFNFPTFSISSDG